MASLEALLKSTVYILGLKGKHELPRKSALLVDPALVLLSRANSENTHPKLHTSIFESYSFCVNITSGAL
jgi:hypothetical protein